MPLKVTKNMRINLMEHQLDDLLSGSVVFDKQLLKKEPVKVHVRSKSMKEVVEKPVVKKTKMKVTGKMRLNL